MPRIINLDGVRHSFPDDATDVEIRAALESPSVMDERTLGQRATDALPNAGGMAGSLVGGSKSNPIGVLLSALGGAGGEGARQTLAAYQGRWNEVPPDIQSAVSNMVEEGVKQGGLEAGGRYILGPVLKLLGRGLYWSALKPGKAVRDEFGGKQVVDTLVSEGVPITRGGAGTAKVEALLQAAGKDTADTIAAAEAAGAKPSTMRPIVQSMDRTRQSIGDRVLRSEPLAQVQDARNAALAENPGRHPPTRLQAMKQAEQALAIQAYKAEARGAPVNSVDTMLHEDLARGLREAIERRVPGVRNKNMRTQKLIGALKAITGAEGRIANRDPIGMGDTLSLTSGLGAHMAGAEPLQAAAVAVIQEALTRPEIASRLGIAMDRLGKPIITPQAMRAVYEAFNQLTGSPGTTAETPK